jgi:hypothetical protein
MTAYELLSQAKRAPKGSRTPTPLQRAIRKRDRVWGDLTDAMLTVAACLALNRPEDADHELSRIRQTRREQVAREARELLNVARAESVRGATE